MSLRLCLVAAALLSVGCNSSSVYSRADVAGSSITVSPLNVAMNGSDAAAITAMVRQSNGKPISGITVHFIVDRCVADPENAVTDANGLATSQVTSPNMGSHTVSAVVSMGGFSKTLDVTSVVSFFAPVGGTTHGVLVGTPLNGGVNVESTYTGTAHFVSSDPLATLPTNYTFTARDAGVRVFVGAVVLHTPGTQTVRALDLATDRVLAEDTFVAVAGPATPHGPLTGASPDHLALAGLTTGTAGAANSFSVTVQDDTNRTVTDYTGTVHFTSTDPQATLPSDYTFASADAGVHTFTSGVVLRTAGSQSIAVTDKVAPSVSGTLSGSVVPAAASAVVVAGIAPTMAGTGSDVTVTVKDAYNNTATGYTGTLHFTSSDVQAALPTNYTFTGADAGAHTFGSAVTLKTAGAQAVTATDTLTGSITGVQSGIYVAPAGVSTLLVTGIASDAAGTASSVTIAAKDAYNNTANAYTGTIHVTSSDPLGQLPGDYVFLPADSGIHTLTSAVTLKTAGTQTVTATDTLAGSITGMQSGIAVQPAAASGLVMTGLPTSIAAGQVTGVTVTATDAYGNAATGYRGTLRFTSADGRAIVPPDSTLLSGAQTFANSVVLKTAGSQSITATDTLTSSLTASQSATVTPSTPSAYASSITASPAYLPANNSNTTTLTVTVWDAYSNRIPGNSVSLGASGTGNTFSPQSGTTDSSGVFTATLRSSTLGLKTVTAGLGSTLGPIVTTKVAFVCTPSFAAEVTYPAGGNPYRGALADIDGDGKLDFAVANQLVNQGDTGVSVLMGLGAGTFGTPTVYGSAPFATAASLGDLNGDGKADMVSYNYMDATVGVRMNLGTGTFGAATSYATGVNPTGGILGDINGDGKLDIIVPNGSSASVSILMNEGAGTFAPKVDYATDSQPASAVLADFDNDGDLDLAVSNGGSASICIYLNQGAGVLGPKASYQGLGSNPQVLIAGDFDGDGRIDIAAANHDSEHVFIRFNQGGGAFGPQAFYTVGHGPDGLATADLNGDGRLDMVAANMDSNTLSVLLNIGSGAFAVASTIASVAPRYVALADVNNDGQLDVVVSNYGGGSMGVHLYSGCN